MDKKIFRYITIACLSLIIMTPEAKSATCEEVCKAVYAKKDVSLKEALCDRLLRQQLLPLNSSCSVCPFDFNKFLEEKHCVERCKHCSSDDNPGFAKWLEDLPSDIS